jgi:hypothetical protein
MVSVFVNYASKKQCGGAESEVKFKCSLFLVYSKMSQNSLSETYTHHSCLPAKAFSPAAHSQPPTLCLVDIFRVLTL